MSRLGAITAGPAVRQVRDRVRALWRLATSGQSGYVIWGAVVVVLVSAMEVIVRLNHPVPLFADDTPSYLYAANNLATTGSLADFYRGPGYPLLINIVGALDAQHLFETLYLIQQALWVLSAVEVFALVALIARSPLIAGIVALLAGLNFYPLSYANLLLGDGFTAFFITTLALCIVVFLRYPRALTLWLVTAACLALMLTLSEWFFIPIPLFAYLAWMAARHGQMRALALHLLGGVVGLTAVLLLYMRQNAASNGFFGISFVQNPGLLGKVLQYRLSGAGPSYAALDGTVSQYMVGPNGWNPWYFGYLHPEIMRDHWALAGDYARAVILNHPWQYFQGTLQLFLSPSQLWHLDLVVPGRRSTDFLTACQWLGQYSEGFLVYAVFFAAAWALLLFVKPTSRHLITEALGAIALLVCFDRLLTVATSYADYMRIQMPSAQIAIILTFGSFALMFALVRDIAPQLAGGNWGMATADNAGSACSEGQLVQVNATDAVKDAVREGASDGVAESVLAATTQREGSISVMEGSIMREQWPQKGGLKDVPQDSVRQSDKQVVIMGAGPAGLSAAYELTRYAVPALVLEADPEFVGGISRTEQRQGYRFDIGGHRFFSKSQEVEDFWTEVAGDLLLTRGRLSRIYYRGKYFAYPLKAGNALLNMGPIETVRCMSSYAWAKLRPVKNPQSLEDWVRNQFGYRLFSIFFKTYTEKVWGISTKELSADWAAQRIKGLNMAEAIKSALPSFKRRKKPADRGAVIKTLIDEFRYPRLGPGQLWERVRDLLAEKGQRVEMGQRVQAVLHENGRVTSVVTRDVRTGDERTITGTDFISTLPIRELVRACVPPLPEHVRQAAESLKYRDFLTVAVVIDRAEMFPDNWIYIHDANVQVGRMQNFKNWSPEMVPNPSKTCLGLEYFCFEGDGLWDSSDEDLVELARRELAQLDMCKPEEVLWGAVVRQPKAYPVYDDVYKQHLAVIRDYLREALPNLHLVGRNGMHHYNNQDHSMMTALLVARNIATGSDFDQWKVNTDAEYHEEARLEDEDKSGRQVPKRVPALASVEK